ncbi:hypothetical protein [Pelosinus sp. UFO1]|nr:hypothetical protein [Pelosinus sp. UFO1]AIF52591.1 hypothetical protein UFO1_3048 [Pelosinus sp. UFO1]
MDGAFLKAVTMMGIALPTMFVVIGIFMLATTLLHKAFPAGEDED